MFGRPAGHPAPCTASGAVPGVRVRCEGLGAYGELVDRILLPRLHDMLAGNAQLLDAIDKVFAFVDATDMTGLGALGAAVLVCTVTSAVIRPVPPGRRPRTGRP
jgi:hypothetical protein